MEKKRIWMEKADRGTNTRNSEMIELKNDGLDFLGKIDGLWRIDLLYLIKRKNRQDMLFFSLQGDFLINGHCSDIYNRGL